MFSAPASRGLSVTLAPPQQPCANAELGRWRSRNAGWLTLTTGATDPSQLEPQLWAITPAHSNPTDALVPSDLFNGLKRLRAAGAVLWASTSGTSGPNNTFKALAWPPRLRDFRVDRAWEGQPLRRIQQRLVWIATGGWRLDVRVYLGTEHPSKSLLTAVQAELNRLTLPTQ